MRARIIICPPEIIGGLWLALRFTCAICLRGEPLLVAKVQNPNHPQRQANRTMPGGLFLVMDSRKDPRAAQLLIF